MTVYYDPDRVESGALPALLAIGDSWFWYPFVSNLLAELSAVVKPRLLEHSHAREGRREAGAVRRGTVCQTARAATAAAEHRVLFRAADQRRGQRCGRLAPVPAGRLHRADERGRLHGSGPARQQHERPVRLAARAH